MHDFFIYSMTIDCRSFLRNCDTPVFVKFNAAYLVQKGSVVLALALVVLRTGPRADPVVP